MKQGISFGSTFKTWCLALAVAGMCSACQKQEENAVEAVEKPEQASKAEATQEKAQSVEEKPQVSIDDILDTQSDDIKSRYAARKPKETLEFFGIEPGMTVAEVLPGDGWYSKILIPYLGSEGRLIAIDYPYAIWHHFNWASRDFITERKTWPNTWQTKANSWYTENAAPVVAYSFDTIPEEENNKADAVLFIRALHNLNRFENRGDFFTTSLKRTHEILKEGGSLCVVQHEAPEDKSLEWADGSRGYLNKADLIKKIESSGFSFVKESDLHHNELDQPGEDDSVWRLPPALSTSQEDEALQETMKAIGESHRMTLLFKKN